MRRAGDAEGATAGAMAQLALFRTPAIAEQVMPFAVLFGSMAALLQLSRKLELVVARAAGVSAWQFLQPGLFVAAPDRHLLRRGLQPGLGDAEAARRGPSRPGSSRATLQTGGKTIWIRQRSIDGQAIFRADGAINDTATITGVTVYTFDRAGTFTHRIEAKEATLHEGFWELKDARILSADRAAPILRHTTCSPPISTLAGRQSFIEPDAVPVLGPQRDHRARLSRPDLNATAYRLQYDVLLARPLLFIAMVFVAASVSLRFFRFGGVAIMVLGGVAAGFMLYVATELMEELGASGLISSAVAAWFPAVVGSLLGILPLLYQEDG